MARRFVVPFEQLGLADVARVGGKNASLGELVRHLHAAGVRVPPGFALSADAFREHLRANDLGPSIYGSLERLDVRDVPALEREGTRIRELIRSAPLPPAVAEEALAAYGRLSSAYGETETDVAVRSSATAEDLPSASFAGQHETYLNVRGRERLLSSVRDCMASLFTDRAIVYRSERGFVHRDVALSVGVQKMVRSDRGSAGVLFTLDTESGFRDVVLVTAAYGLGETVVQGRVSPDEYCVHKPTLARGFRSLIRRELGEKAIKLVYATEGGADVREEAVDAADRRRFALTDDEVLELARWAVRIEEHYSDSARHPTPMDIEWAKDGVDGELYIVQARPETVHSAREEPKLSFFKLQEHGDVLLRGKSVGTSIARGAARVVRSPAELSSFHDGEVLVAESTDPDWEPILRRAAAVITDRGGRTCHAAIVSRELGIPCVVGAGTATKALTTGDPVTVSCADGDEGLVYAGILAFEQTDVNPSTLPRPRVPVMLNLGTPESAFLAGQLPSAGVGLARIEFVISNYVGVHPMALAHPERVADPEELRAIRERTGEFATPADFFIDRLASGVAQIAAAFFPRPVVVRFSDFKTNEYASLLGGRGFEPKEDNPMIGFRGASRYYDERYRDGFALECRAIRRVREEMGLTNVLVMIPFCRTLEEGRKVLAEMNANGLRRGENGLEVYVMCEIPNNVVLGSEFSDLFDGFSIGSNDLTQLTLGVDRDSELLAHIFDETDSGVKWMIRMVIREAHAKGRKVGFCGQAPSDRPEFAAFLEEVRIDSISVTADALPRVLEILART
jgi:pyruvate,water dikinase